MQGDLPLWQLKAYGRSDLGLAFEGIPLLNALFDAARTHWTFVFNNTEIQKGWSAILVWPKKEISLR